MIAVGPGRWGLSRPLFIPSQWPGGGQGTWTTYASEQRLARHTQHFWSPINADGSPRMGGAVLVRLVGGVNTQPTDGNTILLPRDVTLADLTLGDLTLAQRNNLRNLLETWLVGYDFTDYDQVVKQREAFSAAGLTTSSTLRDVLRAVYGHLAHSDSRPRLVLPETHNTEYLDDFSTDPATRWTAEQQAFTYDSTDDELDITYSGAGPILRYSANSPGSIEHESQSTFQTGTGANRGTGPGVRHFNDGTNHCYGTDVEPVNTGTGESTVSLVRSGSSVLASEVVTGLDTSGAAHWWTVRAAAEGTAGNNVSLAVWYNNHGFVGSVSKPSDPGWFGADGSPDFTYTDTAADRHDETTCDQCGLSGRTPISSDYDSRHCHWKSRAITDRSGGAVVVPRNLMMMGLGV